MRARTRPGELPENPRTKYRKTLRLQRLEVSRLPGAGASENHNGLRAVSGVVATSARASSTRWRVNRGVRISALRDMPPLFDAGVPRGASVGRRRRRPSVES